MLRIAPRVLAVVLCFAGGVAVVQPRADDWPQWLGPKRDGVWRETGLIEQFPATGPRVLWRAPIGAGYAGPAVAGPRVLVLDRQLPPATHTPGNAFTRAEIPGEERVLCFDDATGQLLWQHRYPSTYTISYASGPRTTPTVADGRVYTVGAEGRLLCLDVADGRVIWSRDFKADYQAKTPEWGFAGHPLLDGQRLFALVGGPGSVAVAFDPSTGQELWRALDASEPGYCPPTLIEVGGRKQLVIWHADAVNGLEPETGKVVWRVPFKVRYGLTIATPRQVGDQLYLTAFYDGSRLFRLGPGTPELIWGSSKASERDTTALHSIMSTPFIHGDSIYGVCSYGQLRCLNLATGDRVWETLAATTPEKETRWGNAFIVRHDPGNRYLLFNEKGDLILARLQRDGYHEISRAHLLEPTNTDPGRPVVWSHPAFAHRSVYARNDRELIRVSLAAE